MARLRRALVGPVLGLGGAVHPTSEGWRGAYSIVLAFLFARLRHELVGPALGLGGAVRCRARRVAALHAGQRASERPRAERVRECERSRAERGSARRC